MGRAWFNRRERHSRLASSLRCPTGAAPSLRSVLPAFRARPGGAAAPAVLALAILASAPSGGALAQTAVCSNTPASDERVACVEDANDNNIAIYVDGITISATAGPGVSAQKTTSGNGDIDIDVVGSAVATSTADWAYGILAYRAAGTGDGKIDILIRDSTVTTTGNGGFGIAAWDLSSPTEKSIVRVVVRDGTVTTEGDGAAGIYAWRSNAGAGDIFIDVAGSSISTSGGTYLTLYIPYGIYGLHQGTAGNLFIKVRDSTVTTGGAGAHGVFGWHSGTGDIGIDVAGSKITTTGDPGAHGVYGYHTGTGDIDIVVRDGSKVATGGSAANGIHARRAAGVGDVVIAVHGSAVTTTGHTGRGVFGWHEGTGDIDIDIVSSSVKTSGTNARGVMGTHDGAGGLDIRLQGSSVTTGGDGAYGIYGRHQGTAGDVVIVVQDSTITTSGAAAHGIRAIGASTGAVHILIRNAAVRATGAGSHGILVSGGGLDADGNRMQSVTVNGEVWGGSDNGAGIWLVGGGRVVIGPHGRVGAASGAAIRVTRVDGTDLTESPRLLLDVALNGRRVEKVLQGRVVNDNGTTGLTVNNVLLFDDGEGGAKDVWVPNGAWDLKATGANLSTLAFTQRFAPRAAVYEALPGVLLRLDDAGGMGGIGDAALLRSTNTPVWARIAGGTGSYKPDTATVGARYTHDRFSVESGTDFPVDYELFGLTGLTGWAGVRLVSGSAKISSPAGGGRIEARGYGVAGGVAWAGEDGLYGKGRLSLTRYGADLSSATRGGLKSGATGWVHGLDLEGGRRFDLDLAGVKTRLTARGALRHAGVTMDEFGDGLFSRVSVTDGDRLTAGAGVDIETGLLPRDGADRLRLRGSLDAEQVLGGGTKVDVSGTALESKAGGARLGAGFGGAYRFAGYTVGGAVGANGLGSGDTSYSARLQLSMAF